MQNQIEVFLDYSNMYEYFRQTPEFIFLDSVKVVPGIQADGEKLASGQDWYFKYHFPNNPVMPGVFQMEALMQTGGLIINTMEEKKELKLFFGECKSVRISGSVRPGDILKTHVELKSYRRGVAWFEGVGKVESNVTCCMQYSLIAPDEIAAILNHKKSGEQNHE